MARLINKYGPKIMNYVFLAVFIYGLYYCYGLYEVYSQGYAAGSRDGKVLYQQAVDQKLRALSFQDAKGRFLEAHMPRKNGKTWKDQLYRQGWESAIDKETENVPK